MINMSIIDTVVRVGADKMTEMVDCEYLEHLDFGMCKCKKDNKIVGVATDCIECRFNDLIE